MVDVAENIRHRSQWLARNARTTPLFHRAAISIQQKKAKQPAVMHRRLHILLVQHGARPAPWKTETLHVSHPFNSATLAAHDELTLTVAASHLNGCGAGRRWRSSGCSAGSLAPARSSAVGFA